MCIENIPTNLPSNHWKKIWNFWKIQIRVNQVFPTRWRFSGLGIVWGDKFIAPDNFLSLSLTDWPAPDTAILSPTTKRWEAQATPWSTTFATYTPFEVLKYHHSILPQIIKPVSSESRLKAEMSISGETISLVFSRLLIICLTPNHFFTVCICNLKKKPLMSRAITFGL